MQRHPAGGAAARDVRRPGPGSRAGRGACSASGTASAGSDDLGLDRAGRVATVDVAGESCWSPATRTVSCTRRTTSAATAARSWCRSTRRRTARSVRCRRPALPLPLVDLRPRRAAAQGAAQRRSRTSTPATSGWHTVGVDDVGRLRLRPPDPGACRSTSTGQVADRVATLGNYGAGRPGHRRDVHLRRGRQLQGAAGELQRVLPLRTGAPRAVPAGAVRSRAAAPASTGTSGVPHRDGRLDLHHVGHDDAGGPARAGRGRAQPAQG